MAQTSTPMPASVRKHAVAASRGSVLALHAAAGLAVPVSREAERLLRASEGLARAAVACLEQANRRQVASPGGAIGAGGVSSATHEKKKNSRKRSKLKKDMDLDTVELDKVQGEVKTTLRAVLSGPAASLNASAMEFVPIASSPEFDDGWADSLPQTFGPTKPLPVVSDARKPRVLKPQRSSTRSPRREEDHTPSTSAAAPLPVALEAGRIAALRDLDSRPELIGQKVRLIEKDAASGRWICALSTDERIRVLPGKLAGLHTGIQELAEKQFVGAVL